MRSVNPEILPKSVRYVKNGEGGRWWSSARAQRQVHAGWKDVQQELLRTADLAGIKALDPSIFGKTRSAATSDRNALLTLLDRPSQHVWVTFQGDDLWWCTVLDAIETNPDGPSKHRGNFWLTCATPWSNRSLGGRLLCKTELPGAATSTAGFRATVCKPSGWKEILRAIRDERHPDCADAKAAREAYQVAIEKLILHLGEKDFEVLIDLILARNGWARLAKLGGAREGIDIEAENAAIGEIAFVQVKSRANQATLNDYIVRFNAGRKRYSSMIFAVHTEDEQLLLPDTIPGQIWTRSLIAKLTVNSGLGDWLLNRVG